MPRSTPPHRLQPIAGWSVVAAFALIGAALIATVWTTRASVLGASDEVRQGLVAEIVGEVTADLADWRDASPTDADLAGILADRSDEGLRYLAIYDRRTLVAHAGTSVGGEPIDLFEPRRGGPHFEEVNGRLRTELRTGRPRRQRVRDGGGGGGTRIVIEIDPEKAESLRGSATLTLWIGGLAGLALLGVAFVLVRREARRRADDKARERERRLASLGEMSAVLAHEMRNPLASLKGNAQLLAAMLPGGEKPRAKADRVVDEAVRLEQLTNDLLAFVRTGAIQRGPTDPAALARDAAASVSSAIAIDVAAAPSTWSLDGGRVREVLVNLLDNAVAAGPPVALRVSREGPSLRIEVTDHGPGVPPDDREKIFEPFFTGKTAGTGLGLAVARRIVELHRGTIEVDAAPGGGARFTVMIPKD